ncbi:hypothetical protein PMO90_07650 [Bifidobacterium pseudocatenulatum]|uniref:hypothetical protein n=2 Tax=Bifidobacterium pseudocatenulatum TaxID=28026 RepID=UPI00232C4E6E|nr:hypothetical protein [Bifidobacterium pseudocatenulatum]MDB6519111.1 hypothetical protein [Bifidobacterium pseudocatenulatum]MDB6526138.1 hypothetical protein [Bifidobacterium pseudocatenulatum]MDB6527861.1 hypothetical protein [Bifidobacterium pseudocatenulatum]MDB6529665.1 hypothetical protein [Bifidobacterium pseudocatenulatum]
MGVNQRIFERYMSGDETVLVGMPVQKRIKFRRLVDVCAKFFAEYPEDIKPEFAVALTGVQNHLMAKCNQAIEELNAEQLHQFLNERKEYDMQLRVLSNYFFTNLYTDKIGNKYDEKQGVSTRLENTLTLYSKELNECDEVLVSKVNTFCNQGINELISFFPVIWNTLISKEDILKMGLLAKLFSFRQFFNSLKMQLAQSVIIAREKNNSDAVIARMLETDAKKLNRMVKKYRTTMSAAMSLENDVLMAEGPMRAASAQQKLFAERKNKPEYAFVAYLLSHQDAEVPRDFQADLMREFLQTVNYFSFALAVRDSNENVKHPTNAYVFKLRMMHDFLKQYDYSIAPTYESLKRLGVKDDLIQCVLYEGSKEFKQRIRRASHTA